MPRHKLSKPPSRQVEMATIMVGQWTDDRLKKATPRDLCMSYGVTPEQSERILNAELKKRRWV